MKGSRGKRTELDSAGRGEPRDVLQQGYARSDWTGEWKGGRTELRAARCMRNPAKARRVGTGWSGDGARRERVCCKSG